MPQFDCRFITEGASIIEKMVEAQSKFDIYELAEARNEMVLSVKEHKETFSLKTFFRKRQKVSAEELGNFTTQISTMLRSGVPLIETLEALRDQSPNENFKDVMTDVIKNVEGGAPFSYSLSKYPSIFNSMYVNMVKAGERAGVLDELLERISSFIQHDVNISRNVKSALRYPIIVISALIMAFTGAMVFIIPKFSVLFVASGIQLPLPTRIMMGLSNLVITYWWAMILGVGVSIPLLVRYLKTPQGAYKFDRFKLKIPVFKEIFLKSSLARFAHMLQTLSESGIQIIKALETTEETVGNLVLAEDLRNAKAQVAEGIALSEALSKSYFFPRMTIQMISVGEQSGALDKMLASIAAQFDAEVDLRIKRLSASIEPMMTVVIGVFLLLLALGIFLPMWNMYSVVK